MFARVNGAPLRPDWVLDRSQELTEQSRLPRVWAHLPAPGRDVDAHRRSAAGAGVEGARHATSGITVDLYGHLTAEAALAAADSLGTVLDAAAAELAAERVTRAGASSPSESGPRRVLQGVPSGLSLARARPDVERGPAGGAAQNRRCDRRTRSRQTCGCSSRRVGIVC